MTGESLPLLLEVVKELARAPFGESLRLTGALDDREAWSKVGRSRRESGEDAQARVHEPADLDSLRGVSADLDSLRGDSLVRDAGSGGRGDTGRSQGEAANSTGEMRGASRTDGSTCGMLVWSCHTRSPRAFPGAHSWNSRKQSEKGPAAAARQDADAGRRRPRAPSPPRGESRLGGSAAASPWIGARVPRTPDDRLRSPVFGTQGTCVDHVTGR
eukprot:3872482-Prymnesium_polylepis.1